MYFCLYLFFPLHGGEEKEIYEFLKGTPGIAVKSYFTLKKD